MWPAGPGPWRLALVTLMQFREHLADRQAAEAVRARIDWKYLLGLELSDPGFDFSVLSEFRDRLLAGSAEALLLDKLLERCRALGLLKARGSSGRTPRMSWPPSGCSIGLSSSLRRCERPSTNWPPLPLHGCKTVPPEWYERDGKRIEETHLPREQAKRETYAQTVGEDGFTLLDAVDAPGARLTCGRRRA